jgi:hypothetical protein
MERRFVISTVGISFEFPKDYGLAVLQKKGLCIYVDLEKSQK